MATPHRRSVNLAWVKASEAQAAAEEASAVALDARAEVQALEGRQSIADQYRRLAEHCRTHATMHRDAAAQFRRLAG